MSDALSDYGTILLSVASMGIAHGLNADESAEVYRLLRANEQLPISIYQAHEHLEAALNAVKAARQEGAGGV